VQKHTPDPISLKLRTAEVDLAAGTTIAQVCQKLALNANTFHRWRQPYGAIKADEAKRLKERERQNQRLKRLVAPFALDKQRLQEVVQKKFGPPTNGGRPFASCNRPSRCRSGVPVVCGGQTARGRDRGPRSRSRSKRC
jgi:putative transposase